MTDLGSAAPAVAFGRAPLLRRSSTRTALRRRSLAAPGASSAGGRIGRGLLGLLVVAASLAALAIAAGWLTPVVTFGTSMVPTYHAGDLVVIARGSDYATGDIVGYRYNDHSTIVLHRIVGGDATSGFVMQGDHNASIDPYTPTPDDIVGRAVLHVPKVGVLVRSPAGLVGLLGGVALLGLVTVGSTEPYASRRRIDRRLRQFQRHRQRRSRRRHPTAHTPAPTPAPTGGAPPPPTMLLARVGPLPPGDTTPLSHDTRTAPAAVAAAAPTGTAASARPDALRHDVPRRGSVALLAVLVVVDVLLGAALLASLLMPPKADPPTAAVQQTTALRYGATVAPGVAYPDGTIVTGQPVFRQIADRIDVSVDYDLTGRPAGTFRADASLWLEVLSTSGWSRTTTLAQGPVTELPARLVGTVDLSETAAIIAALSAETGVPTGAATIRIGTTIVPTIDGVTASEASSTIELDLSDKALVMRAADQVTGDAAGGPAMMSTASLDEASTTAQEHGGIPRSWRRWIMIALVASIALTAVAWPSRPPSNVVTVSELDLSPHLTRIRMDDPAALDEIAAHERAPVLAGDGWRAVLVEQRLYWDGDQVPCVREPPLPV